VTVSYGTAPASAHGTNGGVPKAARYEMVTRFPTDDVAAPALFVLSLNAGGPG